MGRASGASSEAKLVVNELQSRLTKEMEEREVESAMYNARLYENEKQQGDWYVERRILERRIKELELEVRPVLPPLDVRHSSTTWGPQSNAGRVLMRR